MNKTCLVTFATKDFEPYRKDLIKSAEAYDINNFFSYDDKYLKNTSFFKSNHHIFKHKRGYGFWLWKPFLISESLKKIEFGDIILYVDSGSLIISDPSPLINICNANSSGIVAFDCRPLKNSQWTKRDTFINMSCDNDTFWNSYHVIATVILIKKNDFTISFINEWLECSKNFQSLSNEPNVHKKENLPEFIEHREDQSIFSILIKKYNIETYRNPSKWGDFMKIKEFREVNDEISSPYRIDKSITEYSHTPQENSNYGTIFKFNRKQKTSLIKSIISKIKN